jgi:hypothetical protein
MVGSVKTDKEEIGKNNNNHSGDTKDMGAREGEQEG